MTLDRHELTRLLDAYHADHGDVCPPTDVLVAAAGGHADRATRERVADHLIACGRCAEEYRLAQELAPWAPEHAHVIGEPAGAPFASRAPGRLAWAYATAAVLAIVAIGLGTQVVSLKRETRQLMARATLDSPLAARPIGGAPAPPTSASEPAGAASMREQQLAEQQNRIADLERQLHDADLPDLNAPIVDLEPADAPRSAGRTAAPSNIPADARHVVFVLNTTRHAPGASYDVELVDASGGVVWTGAGLKQSADGTLTLVVPRALIGNNSRLRLYGQRGTARTLVEQYAIPAVKQ